MWKVWNWGENECCLENKKVQISMQNETVLSWFAMGDNLVYGQVIYSLYEDIEIEWVTFGVSWWGGRILVGWNYYKTSYIMRSSWPWPASHQLCSCKTSIGLIPGQWSMVNVGIKHVLFAGKIKFKLISPVQVKLLGVHAQVVPSV